MHRLVMPSFCDLLVYRLLPITDNFDIQPHMTALRNPAVDRDVFTANLCSSHFEDAA